MLQLNHKIVQTPAAKQFHFKVESLKTASRFAASPRIFITCGSLSTAGVCVYFATQKSQAFCKEALSKEKSPVGQNDETSDNDDKCTEKSVQKAASSKSVWAVIGSFIKPDLVWFMLAIPVIVFIYFLFILTFSLF